MRFDYLRFCETNGIEYDATIAKNNIHIDCPFCGSDGAGKKHMGLSTKTSAYGCFKNGQHASTGRPRVLVAAVLRCSWVEASSLVNDQDWVSDDLGVLLDKACALGKSTSEVDYRLCRYPLPRDLFKLVPGDSKCKPFFEYLESRGLSKEAAELYNIHGARTGEFRWRICLPFTVKGIIVGVTGRHIGKNTQRYHTQPEAATGGTVYNYDVAASVKNGKSLGIVEGPFDAIVFDHLCEVNGWAASAVGLAGLGYNPSKRAAIVELAASYEECVGLLDRGAEVQCIEMMQDLRIAGVPGRVAFMPNGAKDPGMFCADDARLVLFPRN